MTCDNSKLNKVSVCIPTFNRKDYLRETLKSVYEQTFRDFEVVIVDDGSNDGTAEMVEELDFPALRYYYQTNKGDAAARNKLIELAQGRYITFIDSDDLLIPDALERMVEVVDSYEEDVIVYGSYLRIDENGDVFGKCKRRLPSGYVTRQLFQDIFIHSCGSMFPRSIFSAEELRFDTDLSVCSDYALWLRLSTEYKFIALPQPTFKRRRHRNNLSVMSSHNKLTELNVLKDFYRAYGKDIIPKKEANTRFSKEQYRIAKAFIAEGKKELARKYLWKSFHTRPRPKPLWLLLKTSTQNHSPR